MTMGCADCGCLVDHGIRIEVCGDPSCCCRELPIATDETTAEVGAAAPDAALADVLPAVLRTSAIAGPTWFSAREALRVVLYRRHLRATTRIATVVGTVLFAINQLDVVITGRATAATWVKAAVTYLVPFTVSNLGILTATRRAHAGSGSSASGTGSHGDQL
jgi:hypothetical protein